MKKYMKPAVKIELLREDIVTESTWIVPDQQENEDTWADIYVK